MKRKMLEISIKIFYICSGLILFALGILGLIFPVIPGIVLLVFSIAAFAKSSQKIRDHSLYIKYLEYMEKTLVKAKKIYMKNKKLVFRQALIWVIVLGILVFVGLKNAQAANGLDENFRQVKTASSPVVYYLDHSSGFKKAYTGETAFLSYGNKWSEVKVISESGLNKWPDLRLVKIKNNPAVYYIKNNQKALIKSEADFLANGFKWNEIAVISKIDLDSYSEVSLSSLINITPAGSITESPITVSVNQTAKSKEIILGSNNSSLGNFRISAGSDKTTEIRSLKIKINGIYRRDAVKNVALYSEGKKLVSTNLNTGNGEAMFLFNSEPLMILPGSYRDLEVMVSTGYYPEWNAHNMKAVIEMPGDILGNSSVKGNFPLDAGSYRLVYAENYLGKIKIEEESLNREKTAVIGNVEQELAKFKISEITKNENTQITELRFRNYGNISPDDVINYTLKDKSGRKLSQMKETKTNEIVFALSNFNLNAAKSEYLSVYADIKGGEGKKLNIQAFEADVRGKNSAVGLSTEIVNVNDELLVTRKSISVLSKDLTAGSKTFAKQNGVILGVFEIRNNDQKIAIENLELSINKSAGAPSLAKPVYLVNYATGELYEARNTDQNILKFNPNNINLKGKDGITLALITEIPDEAKQGDRYNIIFNAISYRLAAGNIFRDQLNLNGAALVVSRSNVYVFANNDFNGVSYIKGRKDVKIASFYLEAAAGEDTKINSITLTKGDTSGLVTYDNGFSDLRVYIGSYKASQSITKPYSDSYVFNDFSYKLRGGERYEVRVYADTDKNLKVSETQLMITSITATSNNSGITTITNNLNAKSNKVYFGGLDMEFSAQNGGQVSAGTKNNIVGGFAIKNNGAEKTRLKNITLITSGNGFSSSLGYKDLLIKENVNNKTVGSLSKPVAGSNKVNLNYSLEPGQTVNFTVMVTTTDNATVEAFSLYFSELLAEGYSSKVNAQISGLPSSSVAVNIGTSNNDVATSTSEIIFFWPVSGKITYGYGANSTSGYPYGTHSGIDINVSQGTKVKSAYTGTVVEVYDGGMVSASYLRISHAGNLETIYGHLSRLDVEVGDDVAKGQVIGLSGGTPGTPGAGTSTTGPHLHFEVRLNGTAVDPMGYLK